MRVWGEGKRELDCELVRDIARKGPSHCALPPPIAAERRMNPGEDVVENPRTVIRTPIRPNRTFWARNAKDEERGKSSMGPLA